jgi:cytochrome b subunit of formate dehydrogenase
VGAAWGVTLALPVAGVSLSPQEALGSPEDALVVLASLIFIISFGTVGAVLAIRRPENPIGWLFLAAGFCYALSSTAEPVGRFITSNEVSPVPGRWLYWFSSWGWGLGAGLAIGFPLLLFPDGRPSSRGWRWLVRGAATGLLIFVVCSAFQPATYSPSSFTNPIAVERFSSLETIKSLGFLVVMLAAIGGIISLIQRFRRAAPVERQQIRWLTHAGGILLLTFALAFSMETFVEGERGVVISNVISTAGIAFLPVSFGIAITRYRLYEIDRFVNRTLVYAIVTAVLALTYLGIVVALQVVLGPVTKQSDLAVAGSTLVVAGLFRPVRVRVQEVVDRRFYRRKFDARQTLEKFSSQLRDEVDLDELSADLVNVVAETMQPAHISLWLREVSSSRV